MKNTLFKLLLFGSSGSESNGSLSNAAFGGVSDLPPQSGKFL